ncbi:MULTISPECIES: twin-arginine translocase TatA/TatE family subunit [unclassified Sphingomonas]|uniref:twin-arginine translocase TatA/TatE family subunit n=1 Tax=unclassified Sphingomonas TaxID=196159 RepID=UPI0006FBA773|nr:MULTISPECIES: twin-arginine translocase TatA/TatE family subunit [unclassified Sphingomonas]KQN06889.1 preprotein translocase subunit TatA [Sphingomonas sp. Leaf25]KQN37102.1 preprotein translocase subunit TatA [Sphingomonas sp. Leaf42]KQT30529.1 preprotein translocase subunit TatA [Sphingomonas sp. Leaf407]
MGGLSIWHWLIVGVIVLLLFGKGRFSDMMGDVAKGLKSFKKGMAEDDDVPPARPNDRLQQRPLDTGYDRDPAPREPLRAEPPRDADRPHGDR